MQQFSLGELKKLIEGYRKGLKSYNKRTASKCDDVSGEVMFLAGLKTGRQSTNDTKATIKTLQRLYENNYTSSEQLQLILKLMNGPPKMKSPKQKKNVPIM